MTSRRRGRTYVLPVHPYCSLSPSRARRPFIDLSRHASPICIAQQSGVICLDCVKAGNHQARNQAGGRKAPMLIVVLDPDVWEEDGDEAQGRPGGVMGKMGLGKITCMVIVPRRFIMGMTVQYGVEWTGLVNQSTITTMVEIYLNIHKSQAPFLSIPDSDVRRLSKSPFKWLRYVMFSICGAPGDLSVMPDGPPVDYGTTLLPCKNLPNSIYYYNPSANCIFVDYEGLDEEFTEEITSDVKNLTERSCKFRNNVIQQDGQFCIITAVEAPYCNAAHLVPECKGNEYIMRIVEDRSPLYGASPSISGIDDVQNGVLLAKTLHAMLADGVVALIKTPNYGLEPSDIWRVKKGPKCTDYITLQHLKNNMEGAGLLPSQGRLVSMVLHPTEAFLSGGHVDALFDGTKLSLPPAIILDYMYGVSAYKCWRSRQGGNDIHSTMKSYQIEHYKNIPPPPTGPPSGKGDDPGPPQAFPPSRFK